MYHAVTVSAEDCEILFGIKLHGLTFGNFGKWYEVVRFYVSLSRFAVYDPKVKITHLTDVAVYSLRGFRGFWITFELSMGHVTTFFRDAGIFEADLSGVFVR